MQTIHFSSQYTEVFQLLLTHDYYQNGMCKDFSFLPTSETLRTLKKYGLLFKPLTTGNGFRIVASSYEKEKSQGNKSALFSKPILPETKLSFIIKQTNIYFYNFSSISLAPKDIFMYFSNKVIQKVQNNHFLLNRPDKSEVHNLVDNITHWPSLNQTETWGLIDIYLTEDKSKDSLISKEQINHKKYEVQFEARQTYWKYLVASHSKTKKIKNLTVTCETNKNISFSKPKEITLDSGQNVWEIISKKPIPLQQVPNDKFKLTVNKDSQTERILTLPPGSFKDIRPIKDRPSSDKHTQYYSIVYCNLY